MCGFFSVILVRAW